MMTDNLMSFIAPRAGERSSNRGGDHCPHGTILSSKSGAVCITGASRNIVEAVASWGHAPATAKTFAPVNCWALRRGKVHVVKDPASPLLCGHVAECPPNGYICVPLAAQGETLEFFTWSIPPYPSIPPRGDWRIKWKR